MQQDAGGGKVKGMTNQSSDSLTKIKKHFHADRKWGGGCFVPQ